MRTTAHVGAQAALALTTLLAPGLQRAAQAGPADYVLTPIVEAGEREIDFKAGSARLKDRSRSEQASVGLGWGVNAHWFTELYAIWHQPPGEPRRFDAWEWENRVQLTETGKYPVDVGLVLELERPRDRSEGYELRWGPLLQAELGSHWQANLNLLLEKHVRVAQGGPTELGYQWQLKYRWRPELEWGLQGLGDVGPWSRWEPTAEQPHAAGPAVFGRLRIGEHQTVKFNAALLHGWTRAAPRTTARLQAELEF